MSRTSPVKFGVFRGEFLRNHLMNWTQIFGENLNCYALSIFRVFVLLASSDSDIAYVNEAKSVNKDSPIESCGIYCLVDGYWCLSKISNWLSLFLGDLCLARYDLYNLYVISEEFKKYHCTFLVDECTSSATKRLQILIVKTVLSPRISPYVAKSPIHSNGNVP